MLGSIRPIWTVSRFGMMFEDDKGGGAGGEGGDEGKGGTGGKSTETNQNPTDKTFTQADLDRVGRKEKDEGKRAALNELTAKWGMSIEEAEAALTKFKEADDKAKSDAQKAKEKADKDAKAAAEALQEAKKKAHEAEVFKVLARSGMPIDKISNRRINSVEVEVGADENAIKDAVEALKKEEPTWFVVADEDDPNANKQKPPASTIVGPKNKGKVNESAEKAGADLAKEYNERFKPKKLVQT